MNDAIEVTRLALTMARLEQQNLAERIAKFQTGVHSVDQYNFSPLLSRLQQASPEQRAVIARQLTDVDNQRHTVVEEAQLDELVARSTMVSGKFNSLVEGLNRQLGLMSLVLNGGKR